MKQFCKIHLTILMIATVLLSGGCAKNASENAADASLGQVGVVEQQIKKECPTAKIDGAINALRSAIKTQLLTCESEKATLRERNNTLIVIIIGIIAVLGVAKWAKIRGVK